MPARPYRPSGQRDDGVLPILFGGAAALAVVVGIVEGLLSSWINLLMIFPALIGVAAGGFAAARVKSGNVRAPLVAGLLAALAAGIGQGAVYGTRYYQFRHNLLPAAAELAGRPAGSDPDAALDDVLKYKTGHSGFAGYLSLSAETGVEIQHNGSKGPVLTGVGYWIYLGVELAIALVVAFASAWSAAMKPFCETCKRWYDKNEVVHVGGGERAEVKQVLQVLDDGRWHDVGPALGTPGKKTRATLGLLSCAGCQTSDPQLTYTVTRAAHTKKPQSRVRYRTMLRVDEAAMLRQSIVPVAATGS